MEITIRGATLDDISQIAGLFNSDDSYKDPFFNSEKEVRDNWDRLDIAKLVAEDNGRVIGFASVATSNIATEIQAKARLAEPKKIFVHEDYRGKGIAGLFHKARTAIMKEGGIDFSVGTAVSGHPYSQLASFKSGSMPYMFMPLWISTDMSGSGQRESPVGLVKPISEKAAMMKEKRTVYLPEKCASIAQLSYSAVGLDRTIEIVEPSFEQSDAAYFTFDEKTAEEYVLPVTTIDIANPQRVKRVSTAIQLGWIPLGVLPVGTDRLVMMYVPKGMNFDIKKVKVINEAKPLAEAVGNMFNDYAGRK